MPPGPKPRPLAVRIWEKIDQATTPDGCWLWKHELVDGYARVSNEGRTITVTRWLLAQRIGRPLRRTEVARHTCDTPMCCRPQHLVVGSSKDNARDASERRRLRGNHTRRPRVTILTDEDVVKLRYAYAAGISTATLVARYGVTAAHIRNVARGRFRAAAGGPLTRRITDDTEAEEAA